MIERQKSPHQSCPGLQSPATAVLTLAACSCTRPGSGSRCLGARGGEEVAAWGPQHVLRVVPGVCPSTSLKSDASVPPSILCSTGYCSCDAAWGRLLPQPSAALVATGDARAGAGRSGGAQGDEVLRSQGNGHGMQWAWAEVSFFRSKLRAGATQVPLTQPHGASMSAGYSILPLVLLCEDIPSPSILHSLPQVNK